MQKLAGLITEGQYKEKVNEAETNLLTADGLRTFLHTVRNLTNDGNKKKELLDMLETALDSIANINEIEGDPDDYYGYNEPIDPNDYADDYTPPAYTAINDMMDYIKQGTGISGRIVPYRSISWLPGVSDTDGDMDMLTYKKGKQEIAIGADDVYQDAYDENSNVWIIDSNDPDLYFEEHMTFKEAVEAVSEWLES